MKPALTAFSQVQHFQELANSNAQQPNYKGLPIYALPELHEEVGIRLPLLFSPGARVLDIAAGSGAMSRRLLDAGLQVESTDLVSEGFRLRGEVPFHTVDLNENFHFRLPKQFNGVMALEIIEHLENPRHFLRQCWQLLAPGGRLVLSTPNIETPRSLLRLLTHGHFRQFGDQDYHTSGHITPLSQWQLQKMAAEGGWQVEEFTSVGAAYAGGMRHLPAKLLGLTMSFNRREKGAILLLVLRKPA